MKKSSNKQPLLCIIDNIFNKPLSSNYINDHFEWQISHSKHGVKGAQLIKAEAEAEAEDTRTQKVSLWISLLGSKQLIPKSFEKGDLNKRKLSQQINENLTCTKTCNYQPLIQN